LKTFSKHAAIQLLTRENGIAEFPDYQLPVTQLVKIRTRNFIIIPVTRRVKGYTRFVEKYITGRRKRFGLYNVYIFLTRINSRLDLSVC